MWALPSFTSRLAVDHWALELKRVPQGGVETDALHLAAQGLAPGQRGHDLKGIAADRAVRSVRVVAPELGRRGPVGQAVEVGEKVRRLSRLIVPPLLRLAKQVVDQDDGMHLLPDVER